MKIKHYLMAILMLSMGLVACEGLGGDVVEPEQTAKKFKVHLNMTGEISVSQQPMSRFTPDANDLYAIQVRYKPASGGSYKYYAYGLFDDLSNVSLDLEENHYYKFEVVMIDDAKNKIYSDSILIDTKMYHGYGAPFTANNNYNASTSESITKVTNEFDYSSEKYFTTLTNYIQTADGVKHYDTSGVDAYYSIIEDYLPVADNENINVYLKKMVYGLRIVAGEFLTEGTLEGTIFNHMGNYTFKLTPENKIYESTFAYLGSPSGWYKATTDAQASKTESIYNLVWTKADGTKYNYSNLNVTLTRMKITTVNIEFYEDGNVENNSFTMKYEDAEMEDGNTYTHGDEQGDYQF